MGGSSVPSSTTTTTMLDPTRQAALKKSMGYFDKWAERYNGPTYKGPLVAGRTADWYKAQDMAHKLSNRFAEGGITSVRRFDDGGLTLDPVVDPSNVTTPDQYDLPVIAGTNDQVPSNDTVSGGDYTNDQVPSNDTVSGGDYTAKVSSGNAGNPNLFAQMVTNANLGGLFGLTGVQPNQVTNTYTTPGTIGATTITSPYTGGTITAPDKVTGAYTAGTIAAPSSISSGYTAGSITPGDKITSDYTAGTHTIKDVTADKWNQAAMDQYMSPYTKGVVDIALREAERQRGIERLKENTAATQSGAFGGYRQGVVEAEGERNYNQLLSDITTKGRQESYNAAVAQFNADRAVDVAVRQFNENNSMENFKALEQAKQTAGQLKLTAGTANAANALQASIANEQAKQQAGQMNLTAGTANAANALQASIASEQAKQSAGQQAITAGSTNATNAANIAIANEQAKQQAGQMNLTASTANAANALNASIAAQQAAQQAAQMTSTAAQNNIQNGLGALNASINAYAAGLTGAQGLAAIDTAYNNNVKLAQEMMLSTDASERAAGQALMEAMIAKSKELDTLDLTKGQAGAELAGIRNSNAGTSVTVK